MTFSETFLVFLVTLVVFLGVKFGFRKSCLCKRNDKYEVCACLILFMSSRIPPLLSFRQEITSVCLALIKNGRRSCRMCFFYFFYLLDEIIDKGCDKT